MATQDSGLIVTYWPYDSLTTAGTFSVSGPLIIKFNAANKIIWSKKISVYEGKVLGINNVAELRNGDILLAGFVGSPDQVNGKIYNSYLGKLDKNGNLLWLKFYNQFYFNLKNLAEDSNGDIVIGTIDNAADIIISRISASGNFVWSKIYRITQSNLFYSELSNITFINNTLYAFGFKECSSSTCNQVPSTTWAMKMEPNDGSLLMLKSYNYPSANNIGEHKVNYFKNSFNISGYSVLQNSLLRLFRVSLDTDFSILKTAAYNSGMTKNPSDNSATNFSPITGNSTFNITPQSSNKFYYSITNSDFNIIYERKFTSTFGDALPQLIEKNNGRLNFLLTYNSTFPSSFTVVDFSPDYLSKTGCTGEDTSIFKPTPIQFLAGDFAWESVSDNDVASIPAYAPVTDYVIQNQIICKQLSICDSIKIHGADTICNIIQPQLFVAHKRSECIKKIDWQIDSAAISQINYLDDTTISIEFKKSWRGNLIASIKSCGISDTFKIYIPQKVPAVDLGPDTMLCKNNPIVLHAGTGYRNYLWQDGSVKDSLQITSKGTYSVKVIDSCNNVSSDTVFVTQPDLSFSAGKDQSICLGDSVTLSASERYNNYKWNPASLFRTNTGRTLSTLPMSSTSFYVVAEKFPGCNVSDTINVTVTNCPQHIIFPNAFTPDNDGLNDIFKPITEGKFNVYSLRIYNRLGELVFRTSDHSKGWDGKFKSQSQNAGVYVWVCDYTFANMLKKQLSGKVVLLK